MSVKPLFIKKWPTGLGYRNIIRFKLRQPQYFVSFCKVPSSQCTNKKRKQMGSS